MQRSTRRTLRRAGGGPRARYFGALLSTLACEDSGEGPASSASGGGGAPVSQDSLDPAEGGASAAGASGASGGAGTGAMVGAGGSAGGGDAPAAQGGGGASTLSARHARYHRSDGDRALRFELDAVDGLSPYPSSLDYLELQVGRMLDKPDGISFDADETLPAFGDEHVWTFAALDEFSRAHAADDADGPVSIHVLFVDGRYDSGEDSGTVLGLAWGQRHIALFQDAIRSGCSGVLGPLQTDTCELAERSVWAHEIGHVVGLVDNGLAQQISHRDPDHGRHDVSDACLMYWAYEGAALFDTLLSRLQAGQNEDIDFCDDCWADLHAARR